MCEPASHASHNASHASQSVSQSASHASHCFNMKKKLNKEYYYQNAANIASQMLCHDYLSQYIHAAALTEPLNRKARTD